VPAAAGQLVLERLSDEPTTDFSMVAVSWSGTPGLPVTAQVRARRDGQWQEWETVTTTEIGTDVVAASPRGATDPVWLDVTDGVQVKVDTGGAAPADLRVDLIDPGSSAADAQIGGESLPASVATANDGRPPIVSRAQWGADERIRRSCSATGAPKAAFIHHTAGSNGYTQAGAAAQLRADYAYHVKSLGWCDLGYNFVVDKFGTIYEGRAGGVDEDRLGSHTGGFNADTFGIAALGNYETAQPPAALVTSMGRIAGWKLGRYSRNPQGTVVLTARGGSGTTAKYKDGAQVTLPVISGHRSVGNTACPGQHLWAKMDTIRATAAQTARTTIPKTLRTDLAKLVNAMHVDFLGKPADATALKTRTTALQMGQIGAQQLALDLHRSPEGTKSVVTTLYSSVLRRSPDPSGVSTWGGVLNRDPGQVTAVTAMLYASPEYYQRFGKGQDAAWVTSLYRDVLKREPDPVGLKDWTARTRRDGRGSVAMTFLQSWESARYRTGALYQQLLGRPADSAGLTTWPPLVLARGDMALASHLAASLEYYNRAQKR
jgi:hypothetical protein